MTNYGPPPAGGQQPGWGAQPGWNGPPVGPPAGPPMGPPAGPPMGPPPMGPQQGWAPGGYGPPAPPPPPRGGVNVVLIAVVAVLVVVALVGGVLLYVGREDKATQADGKPGSNQTGQPPSNSSGEGSSQLQGRIAWQKPPAPQSVGGNFDDRLTGAWFAPGLVIRMGLGALVAYQASDGKELWRKTAPNAGSVPGRFCAMSRSTVAGVGVVAYGPPKVVGNGTICEHLALVELRTGKIRWTRHARQTLSTLGRGQPDFAGNLVVFNQLDFLTAYSPAGKLLWKRGKDLGFGCMVKDFRTTPRRITALVGCYADEFITYFNPANGKTLVQRKIPIRRRLGGGNRIVNADPAVLYETASETGTDRYLVYDGAARLRYSIPQTGPHGVLQTLQQNGMFVPNPRGAPMGISDKMPPMVSGGGLLVTGTEPKSVSDIRDENKVVAFDAATGRLRWSVSLGPETVGAPVTVTPEGVIAVSNGTGDKPPVIHRLGLADGKPVALSAPYPTNVINGLSGFRLSWTGSEMLAVDVNANPLSPALSAFALR